MLNLNSSTLAAVVEKATHDAVNHPRWLTAIGRAIVELDSNPWIERNDHGGLTIGSPSGECYAANGVCQCRAFEFKIPCWHRAAARIVRLCDEREAATYAQYQRADQFAARQIAAARATAAVNELFA
jgi:hypothetical protein